MEVGSSLIDFSTDKGKSFNYDYFQIAVAALALARGHLNVSKWVLGRSLAIHHEGGMVLDRIVGHPVTPVEFESLSPSVQEEIATGPIDGRVFVRGAEVIFDCQLDSKTSAVAAARGFGHVLNHPEHHVPEYLDLWANPDIPVWPRVTTPRQSESLA